MRIITFSNVLNDCTVEPDDSKPIDSKLQALVSFSLLTKMRNSNINHMIDSKHFCASQKVY